MKLISVGLRAKPVNEYAKAGDINGDGKVSITDLTKSNLASVNLIDIIAPTSFTPEVVSTKDTITVQGETSDSNSGIKEYWFEINNNGWVQNTDKLNTKYTFTGLNMETKYTIRMKAVDKAGNVRTTKRIEIETLNEENANISIVASTEEWTNQNILVAINFNSNVAKEKKQISLDNGNTWVDYTAPITVEKNMTIKARVVNTSGVVLEEQEKQITNIDKLAPKEFTMTVTSTTNSITVSAIAEDADETNEYGVSGIKEYEYILLNGIWNNSYKTTDTTHTFNDLTPGIEYTIKVKAIDNAGNETRAKNSNGNDENGEKITIGTIDDLIESLGGIRITANPSTENWTNQNIRVMVTYPEIAGLVKEISIDDGQNWKTYTGSETIQGNTTIKARMKNNKNQTSTEKILEIANIDKLAPKEFTMTVTSTTDSITVRATAEDAEAQNGSAKSGIAGYKFKINEEEWTEITTSGTHTFSNLTSGTQYTIRVKAIDNAGNERMAKNSKGNEGEGEEITTKTIDDLIEETGEEITITANPSTENWTNQNIRVMVTYPEIAGLTKEISIDNGYNWTIYTAPVEVEGNTTIKARMKDSKNQTSTEKVLEISKIDKLSPKEFTMNVTSTTDSITVRATAEDVEAQNGSAKSGIAGYKFEINEEEWTEITTSGTYTFSNLSSGTQYTIRVKAIDNAGNERMAKNSKGNEGEAEEITTKTIDDLIEETGEEITITANPSTENWTNQNIRVMVTYPEIAGLTKEISIDNGYNWATYTEAVEVEGNTTIKARMKDSKNQTSTEQALLIDKIDKLAPLDFDVTVETTGDTITLTASTADAEAENGSAKSGIAGYKFKIDDEEWSEIIESGEYTFTELTEGQTYKIIVKAVDNAGNETIARNCKNGENEGLDVTPTLVPDYYGKEVTNYSAGGVSDWRVFHKDEEGRIYLITDDYITRAQIPTSTSGHKLSDGDSTWPKSAYFGEDVLNDYVGSEWILNNTNANAQKWLNKYLTINPSSTNKNIKAVAYMMDTAKWGEKFANNDMAEYAIGGPTIELFCASYKVTHPNRYIECDNVDSNGYQVKLSDSSYGDEINGYQFDDFNAIYGKGMSTWIASPSVREPWGDYAYVMDSSALRIGWVYCNTVNVGFRPVVCLKSGYDIVKNDGTDTYRIVDARPTYTVELNANGGIVVPAVIEGKEGETATLPTPTKEDHEFKGWYTDEELTTEVTLVDGKYTITEATTLYAKWQSLQIYAKLYDDGTDKTLVLTNTNKELNEYGTLEASYENAHNYKFAHNKSPWYEDRENITKVVVADKINPTSTAFWFYSMANVKTIDLGNLDTSDVTSMESMFGFCPNLSSLDVSKFNTSKVTNMSNMFGTPVTGVVFNSKFGVSNKLTSLDVSNFNTSNVTDMSNMFSGCLNLTSLDVSNFNTSNVTDMSYMFGGASSSGDLVSGCRSLMEINVSNFDTSKVTNMGGIFKNCSNLTSIDVSNFNTSNVTNMAGMFEDCIGLRSLDVSNFDTSNVESMTGMFGDCSGLTSLNVSNFNTSNVASMAGMFARCTGLTSLDLSNFDTNNVTNMASMFNTCSGLNSITLDTNKFNTSNVTSMSFMFFKCSSLQNLDVSKFDTSNVTNMNAMFFECSALTSLNVSNFNTSKVTNMEYMFKGCSKITVLNVSNFNTSNVTNMTEMFDECSSLQSLNLSNFDTRYVTDIAHMFRNCSNLVLLDVSGFNTSKIDYMSGLFMGCSSLQSLDLSNFDTSKVWCFASMFEGCTNLETLDVSNFNTIGIDNHSGGEYGSGMGKMFKGCTKLTELDLRSFYYPENGYINCVEMFYNCTRLETVKVSSIWHNEYNTSLFNGSIATDVTRV